MFTRLNLSYYEVEFTLLQDVVQCDILVAAAMEGESERVAAVTRRNSPKYEYSYSHTKCQILHPQ